MSCFAFDQAKMNYYLNKAFATAWFPTFEWSKMKFVSAFSVAFVCLGIDLTITSHWYEFESVLLNQIVCLCKFDRLIHLIALVMSQCSRTKCLFTISKSAFKRSL